MSKSRSNSDNSNSNSNKGAKHIHTLAQRDCAVTLLQNAIVLYIFFPLCCVQYAVIKRFSLALSQISVYGQVSICVYILT